MLNQYRKFAFSLVALLAVTISMFKMNVEEAVLIASHKPFHSGKTAFTNLHTSAALLLLETDSEELDTEEADDEVEDLLLEQHYFQQFDFIAFRLAFESRQHEWNDSSQKGYAPPIYLANRNFRL